VIIMFNEPVPGLYAFLKKTACEQQKWIEKENWQKSESATIGVKYEKDNS